jgi:cytochrome P450
MVSSEMRVPVPDHVPPECVWDHDFSAFLSEGEDPFLAAARLHDGPGVIWATNAFYGMPSWIITQHALVFEAFADAAKFSNLPGPVVRALGGMDRLSIPVEADAPLHMQYRRILQPFFTPKAINALHGQVRALSDSLMGSFKSRGHCDFISEFAAVLPNAMVISMMGLPQDMLAQFLEWERDAIRAPTIPDRKAAGAAIKNYLHEFLVQQKHSGRPASELMGAIIHGRMSNRPLNDREMDGLVYLLFLAGLDTTLASLGWIARHLAVDAELQERLRSNPADIPLAVEEFTRAFGVSSPPRVVAQDIEFHGVQMKKGDNVFLPTFLAGRDPRAFADPHRIDIDRKPRHVTFGNGAHVCVGIHLAKREMAIMIEAMLKNMKNVRMQQGENIEYHTTGTVGIDYLPIEWDVLT